MIVNNSPSNIASTNGSILQNKEIFVVKICNAGHPEFHVSNAAQFGDVITLLCPDVIKYLTVA